MCGPDATRHRSRMWQEPPVADGMEVIETIAGLRTRVAARRAAGPVGLVPTMGALHAGHASLIVRARGECATVIVSIFVNPTQFDRAEDLERYPRSLDADLDVSRSHGADLVFAPAAAEMYPAPLACSVDVGHLADHLCGRFRPGHFRGVATVVLKLFQIAQADRAYFGEKDAQQLAIVRRMTADFDVPVTIVGVETVREADGLAMSSRNRRLSPDERRLAPALHRALQRVREAIARGAIDAAALERIGADEIPAADGLRLEYLAIVDPVDFQPVARVAGPVVAAAALWVGSTRLIDNVTCVPGAP